MKRFFFVIFFLAFGASQALWCSPEAPLTLAQITQRILQVSPVVQEAKENVNEQEARLGETKSAQVPQGFLNSTATGSNGEVYLPPPSRETFPTVQNTLTISIPVGGELKSLQEAEENRLEKAKALLMQTQLEAVGLAQEAYFSILKNKALLDIAQENLNQAKTELDIAKERYQAGDAPKLDVLKAEVPVALAEADLLSAKANLHAALEKLATLLELPVSQLSNFADIKSVPSLPLTLQDAEQQAQANAPSVLSAFAEINAEKANVEAVRQEHNPTLALQAVDVRSGDLTAFSRLDTIGVSVSIPLWDGGLLKHKIQEEQAKLNAAQAALNLAKQNALLNAEEAYLNTQSALAKIPLMAKTVKTAWITLEKTKEGYKAGFTPILDVLNAQRDYTKAQIAYAEALYDAAALRASLYRALGKELPPP
jgi:outer membrane protein